MRELNLQYRQRAKPGCQQPEPGVAVQPPGNQVYKKDGAQVKNPGKHPANHVDQIITGLPKPLTSVTYNEQRQRAINIKGITSIVRVQAGSCGIKIVRDAFNRRNAGLNHGQKTFIRVKVLVTIPLNAGKAEDCARQQHHNEQQVPNQVAAYSIVGSFFLFRLVSHHLSLRS